MLDADTIGELADLLSDINECGEILDDHAVETLNRVHDYVKASATLQGSVEALELLHAAIEPLEKIFEAIGVLHAALETLADDHPELLVDEPCEFHKAIADKPVSN